jgi:hypothetical protein
MKTDLKSLMKSMMAEGLDPDELYVMLEQAEDEYKADKEAQAKAEKAKQVQAELKTRAAIDVYNAYVKYFNAIYPTDKLPKDADKLFMAELQFIDYMMTGQRTNNATIDDIFGKLLKDLTRY